MKYSVILFDLDDTLLDFGKAEKRAVDLLMKKYGVPQTDKNKELYVSMNKKKWRQLEKGLITRHELFSKRFSEYFSAVGVEGDGIQANEDYIGFLSTGHFLLPGALETCRELSRTAKLYIITNGALKAQEGRLAASPLMRYISGVFISEKIGYDKPDPRFMEYVLAHIDEKDKRKILIVGDSPYSDIACGKAADIDTCLVGSADPDGMAPDYRISDISMLAGILSR